METINVKMAGLPFSVTPVHAGLNARLRGYQTEEAPAFSVVMTQADLDEERDAVRSRDGENAAYSDAYLEWIALHRLLSEQMLERNVLLVHGSAVAVDGEVYLFTAPSGTGKSTHARMWREVFGDRVTMVNDDKPFLRFADGQVLACGSPWDGKHRLSTNTMLPLKAVCILERGEENTICRIPPAEALFAMMRQIYRSEDAAREAKSLEMLDILCRDVPLYRLHCNISADAARTAYAGMTGETI